MLNRLFGMGAKQNNKKFVRILSTADWFSADVTCQPSQWNDVGSYTVLAQQQATFGGNDPTGGGSIAGRSVYVYFEDLADALQEHGKVRFVLTNAQETNSVVVMEEHTRKLSADQNDRTKAVLMPEYPSRVGQDSKLKIKFYPDSGSAVTIDYSGTNTLLLVPVTIYQ